MEHGIGRRQVLRGQQWVKEEGFLRVWECPEGIARRWDHVIQHARRVAAYGWPGPWDEEDARVVQAVDLVREVLGD